MKIIKLMIFLMFSLCSCGTNNHPNQKETSLQKEAPLFIAHGSGEYNGRKYLNCFECINENYDKGFRYFEVDFMLTVDGHLAALHDGMEFIFNIPYNTFTYDQFSSSNPEGFTPLTENRLMSLFKEKTDWYLVTDVKTSDNVSAINNLCQLMKENDLSCADRLTPYFFSPDEYQALKKHEFKKMIFGLYRYGNNIKEVEKLLLENPFYAIALPEQWWSEEWRELGIKYNVKIFIHTINSKERSDEFLSLGADGIITDTLFY